MVPVPSHQHQKVSTAILHLPLVLCFPVQVLIPCPPAFFQPPHSPQHCPPMALTRASRDARTPCFLNFLPASFSNVLFPTAPWGPLSGRPNFRWWLPVVLARSPLLILIRGFDRHSTLGKPQLGAPPPQLSPRPAYPPAASCWLPWRHQHQGLWHQPGFTQHLLGAKCWEIQQGTCQTRVPALEGRHNKQVELGYHRMSGNAQY